MLPTFTRQYQLLLSYFQKKGNSTCYRHLRDSTSYSCHIFKKRVTVHVTDIYATVPVTPVIFLKKSVTVHVIDIYVVVLVLLQLKPQFNLNFCQVYTPLCHVAWPARPVPWWPSAPPKLRGPHPYPAPAAPSPESASSAGHSLHLLPPPAASKP